jgi:hypothetical protein
MRRRNAGGPAKRAKGTRYDNIQVQGGQVYVLSSHPPDVGKGPFLPQELRWLRFDSLSRGRPRNGTSLAGPAGPFKHRNQPSSAPGRATVTEVRFSSRILTREGTSKAPMILGERSTRPPVGVLGSPRTGSLGSKGTTGFGRRPRKVQRVAGRLSFEFDDRRGVGDPDVTVGSPELRNRKRAATFSGDA